MKGTVLIAVLIFLGIPLLGQNALDIEADCSTDFWTTTFDGYIQQWSLDNGSISGGDTILSGGGPSLAYCGDSNAPTFYSNNYNPLGIIYYEADSGWVNIPTSYAIDHGGGHLNDQYFRVEGAVIQIVKYWDGTDLLTVDSLNGEFFVGVQDIAVDTDGQAWIFIGAGFGGVDSLKVYNQTGKVKSYAMQFYDIAYGAFFLNDILYIGSVQDSIYPIIVGDSTASLGSPIAFANPGFTDMASCQSTEPINAIQEYQIPNPKMYPNPTDGYIELPYEIERANIAVYNARGQQMNFSLNGKELDIHGHLPGMYFIKIINSHWADVQRIILW